MIKHPLDVIKLMTPFPFTIESSQTLPEARGMIEEHEMSFVPVTDQSRLVGIITKRDIDLAYALVPEEERRQTLKVKDLCTYDPYIVEAHERAVAVIGRMKELELSSALVVKHGRLVGIITCANAYDLLLRCLQGKSSNNIPDIPA